VHGYCTRVVTLSQRVGRGAGQLAFAPHDLFVLALSMTKALFQAPVGSLEALNALRQEARSELFVDAYMPTALAYGISSFGDARMQDEAFKRVFTMSMRRVLRKFAGSIVGLRLRRTAELIDSDNRDDLKLAPGGGAAKQYSFMATMNAKK